MRRARLAAWLATLALGVGAAPLAAQISPGPLARPHHELEGPRQCTRCHGGGRESLSSQCTSCHQDIAWLRERKRGYHARDGRGECASCHPDHAGPDFALVQWPDQTPERFAHARAGWELAGSHRDLACDQCHTARLRTGPAARLSARKSPGGWVGLDPECSSCHEDVHRGALDRDCATCHDAGKWTVTPGFDHDRTHYPLTGEHSTVGCDKCHLAPRLAPRRDPAGHLIPIYTPVPHAQCSSCHEDPHAGRLGPACDRCHTTRGFRTIDRNRFDHDRTRYPLRGRHAAVACAGCHDFRKPDGKRPPFATCRSCHSDPHGGTATLAGQEVDCEACHTVAGFLPSSFSLSRHQATRYPLEGKHRRVRCAACHAREPGSAPSRWGSARVVLRPAFAACRDCHADDHGTQLAARPDRGECAVCHSVQGCVPSRFDRSAHARLKLPLEGRHAAIPCSACHGARRPGLPPITLAAAALGRAGVALRLAQTDCADCHADPHRGRFAPGGPRAQAQGCLACHTAERFRPSTVDQAAHQRYALPLEGAHRAVPCFGCHREITPGAAAPRPTLVAAAAPFPLLTFARPSGCADCHADPHGGQFAARRDGGQCDGCHGVDAFAPASRFDHDRDAAFPLRGAHEKVPCRRCHPTDLTAPGPTPRLVYRPVSGKCENCHGNRRGT